MQIHSYTEIARSRTFAIFEMRCEGVAVLSKEDAIRLGATGPVIRGSGVDMDVRRDEPYSAYGDLSR